MANSKITKKAKVEQYDSLKHERDMYMLALSDVLNGDVIWSSWMPECGGGKYRVAHAGPDRMTGGAMLVLFRQKAQRDSTGCFMWDEMASVVSQRNSEWGTIVDNGVKEITMIRRTRRAA